MFPFYNYMSNCHVTPWNMMSHTQHLCNKWMDVVPHLYGFFGDNAAAIISLVQRQFAHNAHTCRDLCICCNNNHDVQNHFAHYLSDVIDDVLNTHKCRVNAAQDLAHRLCAFFYCDGSDSNRYSHECCNGDNHFKHDHCFGQKDHYFGQKNHRCPLPYSPNILNPLHACYDSSCQPYHMESHNTSSCHPYHPCHPCCDKPSGGTSTTSKK